MGASLSNLALVIHECSKQNLQKKCKLKNVNTQRKPLKFFDNLPLKK